MLIIYRQLAYEDILKWRKRTHCKMSQMYYKKWVFFLNFINSIQNLMIIKLIVLWFDKSYRNRSKTKDKFEFQSLAHTVCATHTICSAIRSKIGKSKFLDTFDAVWCIICIVYFIFYRIFSCCLLFEIFKVASYSIDRLMSHKLNIWIKVIVVEYKTTTLIHFTSYLYTGPIYAFRMYITCITCNFYYAQCALHIVYFANFIKTLINFNSSRTTIEHSKPIYPANLSRNLPRLVSSLGFNFKQIKH